MKKNQRSRQRNMLTKTRLRNLSTELVVYQKLTLTRAVAKSLQSYFECLITIAKTESLANRRRLRTLIADQHLTDQKVLAKLFKLGQRYQQVSGGYTRILKLQYRLGDGTQLVSLQLT